MSETDLHVKVAELEKRIKELEHDKLVNLYGYSNLERAILTTMLTEKLCRRMTVNALCKGTTALFVTIFPALSFSPTIQRLKTLGVRH